MKTTLALSIATAQANWLESFANMTEDFRDDLADMEHDWMIDTIDLTKDMLNIVDQEEQVDPNADPDFNRNFEEIVQNYGATFESHPVTTEDGYILNVYRITRDANVGNQPIFLMHGITDSADCWIMHNSTVAPAFQLLEKGYDVWLGNQRGTTHSLEGPQHVNYTSHDREYWDFSWVEMGDYDAPAQVDYVRKATGFDKLTYIGHSQGTTQMFYAISKNEEFWAKRLNLFAALAPVTRLDHTKSGLFEYLAGLGSPLASFLNILGIYDILGSLSNEAIRVACGILPIICSFGAGFFITQNPDIDDPIRFQVYMGHFPAGASVKSIDHYSQEITSKYFQVFDYGKTENMERYGTEIPPEVDLRNITGKVPIAMFVGTADDLGDLTDSRWARDSINEGGDAITYYQEHELGHASFMVAKNMTYFDDVLQLLTTHDGNPNMPTISADESRDHLLFNAPIEFLI